MLDPFRTDIPSWWRPPPVTTARKVLKVLAQVEDIFVRCQQAIDEWSKTNPGQPLTLVLDQEDYDAYVANGYNHPPRRRLYGAGGCTVIIRPQRDAEDAPNI